MEKTNQTTEQPEKMYKYILISFFLYMAVVTVDMDIEITRKEMEEENCVIKNLFSMITIVNLKFNLPFYYRSFDGLLLFKLEIHSEFKAYLVRTITYLQVTFSS